MCKQPKSEVIIPKKRIVVKIRGNGSPSRKVKTINGILASIITVPFVIKQIMQISKAKQIIKLENNAVF